MVPSGDNSTTFKGGKCLELKIEIWYSIAQQGAFVLWETHAEQFLDELIIIDQVQVLYL